MKRALTTHAPYLLLAAAIMLPLLMPGYILTLDLVFTPVLRMPAEISSGYLWQSLLHVLDIVFPSQLIEKMILISIPLLASIGMHASLAHMFEGSMFVDRRLNRSGAESVSGLRNANILPDKQWTIAIYAASIFYAVNPFTYSRFMAGQYAVLLGYALLPWFTLAFIRFLANPNYRTLLKPVGIALLISIISIHTVGELLLIIIAVATLGVWQKHGSIDYRKYVKLGAVGLGAFIALSGYWLVPALAGSGEEARMVHDFDRSHAEAFATVGSNGLAKVVNVLDLQGFWAEGRGMFALPQDKLPGWGTVRLMIWILVGIGFVACWRTRRGLAIALGSVGALSITLAVGFPQTLLTAMGYREPHKFTGMVAFVFAVLIAFGIASLLARMRARSVTRHNAAASIVVLTILLFTPTMYWGFAGQLKPRQYPESWGTTNSKLHEDSGNFEVLFLPWHKYMSFDFAGRIIGNPAPDFFDKPIISSQDPELDNIKPNLSSREQTIARLLKQQPANFANQLAKQDIKYIILAKDYDFRTYSFLNSQKTLRILTDTPDATLYLNTSYKEDD